MAATIRIPTPLRKFTDGKSEVDVEGSTVREIFDDVENRHGGLKDKIFDDAGEVRRFINVFVNGEDVRHAEGLDTPVKDGDELSVVPARAGGRGSRSRQA